MIKLVMPVNENEMKCISQISTPMDLTLSGMQEISRNSKKCS